MFIHLKNFEIQLMKKGKEGVLFLILVVGIFVACEGALEGENPFGPTTTVIRILPSSTTVLQGANFTFATLNGSAPVTWTSSNILVGTIVSDTGVFTGGAVAGTVTITITDAVGDTATATVTVPSLTLGFDVVGLTQAVAGTASPAVNVNANNSGAGVTVTIANNNTSSTFIDAPTIGIVTDAITITSPATLPNGTQGDQIFTVTVKDLFNNNTGTFIYTLTNDGT